MEVREFFSVAFELDFFQFEVVFFGGPLLFFECAPADEASPTGQDHHRDQEPRQVHLVQVLGAVRVEDLPLKVHDPRIRHNQVVFHEGEVEGELLDVWLRHGELLVLVDIEHLLHPLLVRVRKHLVQLLHLRLRPQPLYDMRELLQSLQVHLEDLGADEEDHGVELVDALGPLLLLLAFSSCELLHQGEVLQLGLGREEQVEAVFEELRGDLQEQRLVRGHGRLDLLHLHWV
mmetsp:Transcript_34313/g.33530  ORF Transcript_34313/g.33530 Transcript_34313/m.33530 type:complete len:232 (-) Transcript_34313:17-712(-)